MADSNITHAPSLAPALEEEAGIDVRQYLFAVRRRLWLVVLLALVSTSGTAAWTLRQPRFYAASATVAIDTTVPKVLTDVREVVDTGAGASAYASRSFLDLQLAILRSREFGVDLARRLLADPRFVPIGERDRAMNWLPTYARSALRVGSEKDSRVVVLSAEDQDPERAATLVNTAADLFVEQNLSLRLDTTVGAADWLVDQVTDLSTKLESSEVQLNKFKEKHDILSASFEDKQNMVNREMEALTAALTAQRLKRLEAEVTQRAIKLAEEEAATGNGAGYLALPFVARNEAVHAREQAVLSLKNTRAELLTRYGPMHPKVEAIERQIAFAEQEMDRQVKLAVQVEQAGYQQLLETERMFAAELDKARTRAFEVHRGEVEYNRLRREKTNNERLYDMVLKRQKETELSGAMRFNNMRVLDRAVVNNTPVRPNNTRNVMFGFLLGLMLGVALALLIELLDNTVKGQADIEQRLGITFLGIMPSIKQVAGKDGAVGDRDLHVFRQPKSPAAECCRAVRTNLLFMGGDTGLKSMAVTSASPSEGKTTAAISLAIAMAQAGSRVLLVDTDLRRPRIHKSFGLSGELGVTSVLVGESELKDAIKSTEVPGLFVLPSGPIPPNPAELLHTQRFQEMVTQLGAQFDRVIFDSPPAGAVADPLVLSAYVQGVVLAVRAGKSSRESVARARRALTDVNARILGAVLNDLDLDKGRAYYQYYPARYGYVYGAEGENKPETA